MIACRRRPRNVVFDAPGGEGAGTDRLTGINPDNQAPVKVLDHTHTDDSGDNTAHRKESSQKQAFFRCRNPADPNSPSRTIEGETSFHGRFEIADRRPVEWKAKWRTRERNGVRSMVTCTTILEDLEEPKRQRPVRLFSVSQSSRASNRCERKGTEGRRIGPLRGKTVPADRVSRQMPSVRSTRGPMLSMLTGNQTCHDGVTREMSSR
jgi:hypothetical protein